MTQRFPAVVAPALALALAACATDAPTSAAPPRDAPALSLAVQGEALHALAATVTDAHARLLPALGDAGVQARLGTALTLVDAALSANDADALASSLVAANGALDAEAQALGPDAPAAADLDALALTLGAVGDALPPHLRALVSGQ